MDVWDLLHAAFQGRRRRVSRATATVALLLTAMTARVAPGVLEAIAESYTEHVTTTVTAVVEHQMQQLTDKVLPTTTTIAEDDHQ